MTIRHLVSKRLAVIAAAALLMLLLAAALYFIAGVGRPGGSQALKRFIAYMNSPRITYIRTSSGTGSRRYISETWLDPRHNRAKEVTRSGGRLGMISVRAHGKKVDYAPREQYESFPVNKDTELLWWEEILKAAKQGEFKEQSTEPIGDRELVWYRSVSYPGEDEESDHGEESRPYNTDIALDSETGIPQRLRHGFSEETQEVEVKEVRQLPASRGPRIFRLPKRRPVFESTEGLTVSQLSRFKWPGQKKFRPVWLGPSVNGADLTSIDVARRWRRVMFLGLFYDEGKSLIVNEAPLNTDFGHGNWAITRYVERIRLKNGDPAKIQRFPGSSVRLVVIHKGTMVRIDGEGGQSAKEFIDIAERYLRRV